jgi:putative isomerase
VPSRNGYLGIWHWDAYFHALGYRHVDPKLAQDQVRIMLAHQLEDGMIPDVVHDEGILAFVSEAPYRHVSSGLKGPEPPPRTYGITKPPLTAWTAWKLYEIDGDADFLASVYDAIVRAQAWWIEQRDSDRNGLCEYHHRYSSGLDDSPLWDGGLPVESPDLNAYLCMQYDDLARIARVIGREEDVPQWESRASRLAECLTEAMWDSEAGLFRATRAGQPIATRTPFNLYPLITGRLPAPIADRVVATLTDPRQFWGTYPVPTVALDDPAFDPLVMWRGPVWINPNYLLVDGLLRAGYAGLARTLRQRTLDLMMRHADFYEFYHPITAEKPPHASNMFGWSAALFIDLAITESADAAQQGG